MSEMIFGPYRIEGLIGRGGMGEVYRAFDTRRGRVVALKRLPAVLVADTEFTARFRREAALAARLNEPHIIPIHDFGQIDGQLYIDMRLVDGRDLEAVLAEHGALAPRRAIDIVSQVAAALDAAHAEGLVHRDIKPGNVMVTGGTDAGDGEFVYVTDFGIARTIGGASTSVTATGATVGSLDYMAPERFLAVEIDHRIDVYSLGCMLFELLTARRPFMGEGLPAMLYAHLNLAPPRPSELVPGLPAGLDAVIAKAMAKRPDDRFASAGTLAAAARAAVERPPTEPPGRHRAGTTRTPAGAGPLLPGTETRVPSGGPLRYDPAGQGPVEQGPVEQDTVEQGRVAHGAAGLPGIEERPVLPQRRRGPSRVVLVVTSVVAVLLAVAGAGVVAFLLGSGTADAAEIRAEPVNDPGVNPFMPPAGTDKADVKPPPNAEGSFRGSTPGLYGGTRDNAACNRDTMVAFLETNPAKAAAWGEVQGISAAEVAGYVAALTPVILRADTAVTNHGYANGRATRVDSILQAGSAVLVDAYGVPRARCACGNPLLPPRKIANAAYVGAIWVDFRVEAITVVEAADAPIVEFVIVAPGTGEVWARPGGTTGEHDRDAPPDAFDPVTDDPYIQDATPEGLTTETSTEESTTTTETTTEDPSAAELPDGTGTQDPTTENPTTENPTTEGPTTENPTTEERVTEEPTTENRTTENRTTENRTTRNRTTENRTTKNRTTENRTTEEKVTEEPVTEPRVPERPTAPGPDTEGQTGPAPG